MTEQTNPKVFISYSWTTQEHQNWVVELAEHLMSNGVNTILDVWDLKEGQDKYQFMESMVQDPEVTKVLVICDKAYTEKANQRKGGVGTETQIISSELYEKTEQTKFIPVVVEYDQEGKAYLPTFIKSRIYIDLSNNQNSSDDFEKLLRAIYDKPLHKKPTIGKAPSFLEEETTFLATSGKFHLLKDAFEKDKSNTRGLLKDFLEEAGEVIKSEYIDQFQTNEHDEEILKSIEGMKPLKDQFCTITDQICRYEKLDFFEEYFSFFEDVLPYMDYQGSGQFYNYQFDNIKFITEEIFLHIIAILLKNQKFKEAHLFINSPYLNKNERKEIKNVRFAAFKNHIASLDEVRKNRLQSNQLSLSCDLMKERCDYKGITFHNICEADYILWFNAISSKERLHWFPGTLIYVSEWSPKLEIFIRAESKVFFEKFKTVLNVKSLDDLKATFAKVKEHTDLSAWRYQRAWHPLPLEACLNLEKLATL